MIKSKRKKGKGGVFFFVILILCCCLWLLLLSVYNNKIEFNNKTINIEKGDNITKFYQDVGGLQKIMLKLWLKNNEDKIPLIQEGVYELNGKYTKEDFLKEIAKGVKHEYIHVTILEGRSRYDIDAYLSEIGLISPGEYIAKTEDQYFIQSLKTDYSFLFMIPEGKSLEGFLYPDTYYLDEGVDIREQLIKAQIKNFEKKIWNKVASDFEVEGLQISPYGIITLASIIENEEKNIDNKPIIAGIFINRLNKGMRLDADVTLCYGLKIVYSKCRENINKNLNDASNQYNTRQNYGLTPTPISSPTVDTIESLLKYKKTSAIFYLHDNQGGIHYSETIEGHNNNKDKYL